MTSNTQESSIKLREIRKYLRANNFVSEIKLTVKSINIVYDLYINKKIPENETKLSQDDMYFIMIYYVITNNRDMFSRYMLMFCGITDEKEIQQRIEESHKKLPNLDIRKIKSFPGMPLQPITELTE